ncbi:helix-turn-helix domain-containing protein [Nocardia pseudobrasiliensis]|uniref:Helix-turn-helix protein n=1 Tax=Nocardia pseudobrasiliensis TaxID=45979 RepID=A0A370IA82_9NOCA|nr:helix-turn-helix transcriptional regulator [Nocardia pseudobrasiliensis]RDI67625.1 helix-turn-helix protein [Nocardia pseudobrasiliensis]
MTDCGELGRYLRARREQVRPAEVGLPTAGARPTPGLHREEVATLAGVSVDYYVRLEQGGETDPSAAVLSRIAEALRMTEAQTTHLKAVAARVSGHRPARHTVDRAVRPTALLLLETMRPSPAFIVSHINDLLAANPAGLAVFPGITDLPPLRRNLIRYHFLHPAARTLWPDRDDLLTHHIARLRARAVAAPDDPELASLVGELCVKSPEFARRWHRDDEVRPRDRAGTKLYHHPTVGRIHLDVENLPLAENNGQRMVVYLARPGTPDHDALVLLDLSAQPVAAHPAESG